MKDVKIGDLLIRYKDGFGTLALDFYLDINVSEEDKKRLSDLLTQMNDIVVPIINEQANK